MTTIRAVIREDAEPLKVIAARVFSSEVGAKVKLAVLEHANSEHILGKPLQKAVASHYWVAEDSKGVLLGMIGVYQLRWIGVQNGYLGWFFVTPEMQRQGIGQSLLSYAFQKSRECGLRSLHVETTDSPARSVEVYVKSGFKFSARVDDYWEEGEPLLLMTKRL